jgi:hypothetical protein
MGKNPEEKFWNPKKKMLAGKITRKNYEWTRRGAPGDIGADSDPPTPLSRAWERVSALGRARVPSFRVCQVSRLLDLLSAPMKER